MAFWSFLTQPRLTRTTWHSFQVVVEDISVLLSFSLGRLSLLGSPLHLCALVLLFVCYSVSHPGLKWNLAPHLLQALPLLPVTWCLASLVSPEGRLLAVISNYPQESSIVSCEITADHFSQVRKSWRCVCFSIVCTACYSRQRGPISRLVNWKVLQDTEPSIWSQQETDSSTV